MRHGRFCINTPNILSVFSTLPSFSYTTHFHIHHHYHHHHHHHFKNIPIIMATLSPSHTQALIATTITGLGVLCIIPLTTIADIMIPHIVFFYIILHSSSDKPSRLALWPYLQPNTYSTWKEVSTHFLNVFEIFFAFAPSLSYSMLIETLADCWFREIHFACKPCEFVGSEFTLHHFHPPLCLFCSVRICLHLQLS